VFAVCGDANAEEQIGCREKGHYDISGRAYGVAVSWDYAYVADYYNGLVIVDVGDNSDVLPTVGMIQTYSQIILVLIILACIVSAPSARKRQLRRSASKHLARLDGKQKSFASGGIIMDSSLHADAVSEFQHGHYRKSRNYAKAGFDQAVKTEKEFGSLRKDM